MMGGFYLVGDDSGAVCRCFNGFLGVMGGFNLVGDDSGAVCRCFNGF